MTERTSTRRRLALAALAAVVVAGSFIAGMAVGSRNDDGGVPAESSIDVGFLRDMADHHDQAVQLALIELANGEAEVVKGFALDVIASQRYEIGQMEARLRDWGHGRGQMPRQAMAWMGMAVPASSMPGMATAAELAEFNAAKGRDADTTFVQLMTAHHQGGIHMAEYAWRHAGNEHVRALAERIAKLQRIEVRDLQRVKEALAG